jgi:hypothetical protein
MFVWTLHDAISLFFLGIAGVIALLIALLYILGRIANWLKKLGHRIASIWSPVHG